MIVSVALFIIALALYRAWRLKSVNSEPPYLPWSWPIIGHAWYLVGDSCKLWTGINELAKQTHEAGGVVSASIGPKTIYIITDPDDSFTVANTCLEKDGIYEFAKPWLGDGLFSAELSIWKHHRKLLGPAFSQKVLDSFMGVFNSQSRKLVKELEKEAGKGLFDHWIYTRHNALETICLTALGVDFTDSNLNSKYTEATEEILDIMMERFMKFWWHSPYTFAWSNLKKKQDACVEILHKLSNTVLQKRKTEFNENTCAERSIIPGTKFKAFLDLVLELSMEQGVFTDQQIREEVDTIIVGGYHVFASVIMFTMVLLGSYQEVQAKLYTEIKTVLEDRDVAKTDLSQLVYLEAVLKESMRVYPIGSVIVRKLDRDVKLKDYTLSAGHACFLFLFALHKHPIWGSDVQEFKPERWMDPGRMPDNPNVYAAFSMGRRQCIGKAYSMMSMKTIMAHVVRSYRIHADHTKMRLKIDAMLKPDSGYFVSIEKRT